MVAMTDEPTDDPPRPSPAEPPRDEAPRTGATRAQERAPADDAPAPGPGSGGERPARPRITRSRERRVVAGVCDGAGRYFGLDPVIFRIVLAVLSLTGGIGLIVYGMGWLVIPQEDEEQSEAHRLMSGRIEGAPLTAVLMTLVGCGLYASMLGNATNQAFSLVLLFATAGAVYWSQRRQSPAPPVSPAAAAAVVDAPPAVAPPPEPGRPSWWRDPLTKELPRYLWGPDDGPYGEEDRQAWRQRKRAVRAARRSWPFSLAVFLLAVTALGVGTGVSWPYRPAAVSAEIGLASALAVLGTAFVVASFAGRARGGTVLFSVLTLGALVGVTALPTAGGPGVGTTTWRPADAAHVRPLYERGTGRGLLDLSGLELPAGTTVHARVEVGAGRAEVRLPKNATVVLDYDLGLAELVVPDKVNHGVRIQSDKQGTVTLRPAAGVPANGTVDLHVEVGVGQLKVVR